MDDSSMDFLLPFFCFHSLLLYCSGFWLLMFQHQSYLFNGFCANKHISLYHVSRLNNERTKKIMIEIIAYGVFDGRFSLTKCQHIHKRIENWFWFYSHCTPAPSPASFNSFLSLLMAIDIFVFRIPYVRYWLFFELTFFSSFLLTIKWCLVWHWRLMPNDASSIQSK